MPKYYIWLKISSLDLKCCNAYLSCRFDAAYSILQMMRYHGEEIDSYSLNISQTSSTAVIDADITMATFLDLPIQPLYVVTIRAKNTAGTSAPFEVLIDTQTSGSCNIFALFCKNNNFFKEF